MHTTAAPALHHASEPARSPLAVMRTVGLALFLRELKTRLGGRWQGVLWAVGEPIAHATLMLLVYGWLRAQRLSGIDTLLFLVTGLLPFQMFKSLVTKSMEGIDANQGLFAYRQVRPFDAVLARVAVEVALSVAIMALVIGGLVWLGHDVWPHQPLELMGHSAVLALLGAAFGLLAAVATAGRVAKLRRFAGVAFFPIFLSSGALFPVATLPQAAREALLLNPVLHSIEGIRAAIFGTRYVLVEGASWTVPAAWALVVTTMALAAYRVRRERLQMV